MILKQLYVVGYKTGDKSATGLTICMLENQCESKELVFDTNGKELVTNYGNYPLPNVENKGYNYYIRRDYVLAITDSVVKAEQIMAAVYKVNAEITDMKFNFLKEIESMLS